ncbi:TetR/AcrR family transcriptional regulator, transcriptional repressor for nem operon [Paenibacillus catalpae]|uniref:TetR/AcrR family transcriptional regulator, transcriptional repressor for nem operon n=1 Tax=Paenibacillus catalpae TaxID=1045775 RepID=A0A1I2DKR1_9BACL|nr:TetR/AcrR family transcriptional regulator [Paenibacillus catalpae]SFE80500.1 TetR/AcrR family transcriptional regulator, transcriptional repressor for nem operon [Paenibacillus catalpae]
MARNKEFDEDAVLLKAMKLFWAQGYEKTSMQDLVDHMGIHRRSIYDTFGDKHALYIRALKRYSDTVWKSIEQRANNSFTAKAAIRSLMEAAIAQHEERPQGCLMVNTAVELAVHDNELEAYVSQSWAVTEELIHDLIVKGQQAGELSAALDANVLASYFNNALTGLRVMVKTPYNRDKLQQIIETTISILD